MCMMAAAQIIDAKAALDFLLAGNAHVTFVSRVSGTRYTYRVTQAERESEPGTVARPVPHFVSVLVGPDRYEYLGCIWGAKLFSHGRKSRIAETAPSAQAFAWAWSWLVQGRIPRTLDVWHEGKCGRCGRLLTTPESIASGIGPVCARRTA